MMQLRDLSKTTELKKKTQQFYLLLTFHLISPVVPSNVGKPGLCIGGRVNLRLARLLYLIFRRKSKSEPAVL